MTQLGLVFEAKEPPLRPTNEAKARLETTLRTLIDPYVVLTLTQNSSTMISTKRRGRVLYVRAHAMFQSAPTEVITALANYAGRERITKRDAEVLDEWIERNRQRLPRRARKVIIQTVGEVHDLGEMMTRVNAEYFERRIDARITWGLPPTKKRRRTIKLGSYHDDQRLIRIHPGLDQAFVPAYFVEFVIYHEMLHQVHNTTEGSGRRVVHSKAFRHDERKFRSFAEAMLWERKNINKLLR